jgi:hypothetical protein
MMMEYSETECPPATAPQQWPHDSGLIRAPALANLIMFVHPKCACSRASMGELERLMARADGRMQAEIVFFVPAGEDDTWAQGGLWEAAGAIPGATRFIDHGGRESARFGSATSGQALLYDRQGKLVFEGGITAARRHAGDSAGRASILAHLDGEDKGLTKTPVFGCAISESFPSR